MSSQQQSLAAQLANLQVGGAHANQQSAAHTATQNSHSAQNAQAQAVPEEEEEEEDEEDLVIQLGTNQNQNQPTAAEDNPTEEEVEVEVEVEEIEPSRPESFTVPFASEIQQEITLVVYPEDMTSENLLPGLNYKNPFSRKGGTLRLMTENLLPSMATLAAQKILLLGDAKKATAALTPIYEQLLAASFNALLATSAADAEDGASDDENLGLPIDDRTYVEDGKVNLTFFSPYPDLQEDAGIKQIDNLSIWVSKLNLADVKLNLIFAYTVQDLLDSSVNLVLNNIAQNEKLDAKIYLARSHAFDFHPDLVKELVDSFDAFLCVTLGG